MKLIEHFKEYELAMTEIHQYYGLPLVSYSYTDNMLILQVPIYVKHYKHQTLELFSLQTVPVPYHPKRNSTDENHTYTWLEPDHDMLAMSSSNISSFRFKTVTKLQEIWYYLLL